MRFVVEFDLPDNHPWVSDPRASLLVIDHARTPNYRLVKVVRAGDGFRYEGVNPHG